MSRRPSAPGSQLRKWSNDRFSIIRITTCSMPFEPCGDSAGAALAAVWDRNWEPVITAPVDAPMSWKNVLRVSMRLNMGNGRERRQDSACRPGESDRLARLAGGQGQLPGPRVLRL